MLCYSQPGFSTIVHGMHAGATRAVIKLRAHNVLPLPTMQLNKIMSIQFFHFVTKQNENALQLFALQNRNRMSPMMYVVIHNILNFVFIWRLFFGQKE